MHEIKWTPEKIANFWNFYASNPLYEQTYFSYHSGKYVLKYLEKNIPDFFKIKNILDFGCGSGFLIAHFIEFFKRKKERKKIYGLDFSQKAVLKVKEKFKDNPFFGGAVYVKKLPSNFKSNFFDLVLLIEVVEHLNDEELESTMTEIYRILRPKGYVVITTPNEENLELEKVICPECGCVFHRWQHVRSWSIKSLKEFMESKGFLTIHLRPVVFGDVYSQVLWKIKKFLRKNFKFPKIIYIGQKNAKNSRF